MGAMNPRRILAVFLLMLISMPISVHGLAQDRKSLHLHSRGYGPVKTGMTVGEASNALGTRLRPAAPLDEDGVHCHYVYRSARDRSMGFMVEEGIITRVDVYDDSVSLENGLTVGAVEKEVREAYGDRVTEKVHPYAGKSGKYLVVQTEEGHRMIFEVIDGKIETFRTGRLPSVAYIEGCL